MKIPTVRLIVVTGLVALASAVVIPTVRAAEAQDDAAARKARHEAEMLKKYDADHDGKLDAEEKATRRADLARAKAERQARKRERAEKESEQESK